ncbi:MAG TPA: hypothetical protein VFW16_05440 [Streptosporangiaceae bacterium]|nr:hypothetical protein [Streptosporangiaceae bacterium]
MSTTRARLAACAAMSAAVLLSGCARMDAALGRQWVVVQLASNTSLATARHVTATCAHASGLRAEPVKPTAPGRVVGSVRFISIQASDADMARLQQCLQRFPAVQGLTLTEPGD